MSIFQDKTIEKRVLEVVRVKIQQAQDKYEEESIALEATHAKEIEALSAKQFDEHEKLIDKHVNSVIGKAL